MRPGAWTGGIDMQRSARHRAVLAGAGAAGEAAHLCRNAIPVGHAGAVSRRAVPACRQRPRARVVAAPYRWRWMVDPHPDRRVLRAVRGLSPWRRHAAGAPADPVCGLCALATRAARCRRARAAALPLARSAGRGTAAAGPAVRPGARCRGRPPGGPSGVRFARRVERRPARPGARAGGHAVHGDAVLAQAHAVPLQRPERPAGGCPHCQPRAWRDAFPDRLPAQHAGAAHARGCDQWLHPPAPAGAGRGTRCASPPGNPFRCVGRCAAAGAQGGRAPPVPGEVHATGRHAAHAQRRWPGGADR
ncbi:hypothetical protein D3C71_1221290 [compost metagenome]